MFPGKNKTIGHCLIIHLSTVAGLVVRHIDLSHLMTLSHKGHRTECDNVNWLRLHGMITRLIVTLIKSVFSSAYLYLP